MGRSETRRSKLAIPPEVVAQASRWNASGFVRDGGVIVDVKSVLELHPYDGHDYCIAAFLVGAYQEILGDLHNLLGDTNAVHVTIDETGRFIVDEVVEGWQSPSRCAVQNWSGVLNLR